MKSILTFTLLVVLVPVLVFSGPQWSSDSSGTIRVLCTVADSVLKNSTFDFVDVSTGRVYSRATDATDSARLRPRSRYNDWRYWNGVLNIAMDKLGETLGASDYSGFVRNNVAFSFDSYEHFRRLYHGEGKWDYPFGQLFTTEELDDCGAMGASVIGVYSRDQQQRYRRYIDLAANHIEKVQPRLHDGTLVRSFPRKWTIWADDLYMSVSFLCRMGEMTGDEDYFDDAARQVVNFHKHLFNPDKGIMVHCWYSDSQIAGIAYWGRANGWAMLAQADLLDRLPQSHPQRDTLIQLFRRQAAGLSRYQSKDGLWHQLLDKPDSFEETSCSAMFVYAIGRGIEKGFLDASYLNTLRRGWRGLLTRIRENGEIEGICTGTGVGDTEEFYCKRPTPLNDVHGIGAVLLAGIEALRFQK